MRQLLLNKGNLVVKELAQPLLNDYAVLVAIHYTYLSSNTHVTTINTQEGFFNNIPRKVKSVLESVALHASKKVQSTEHVVSSGYSCAGHVVSVGKKVNNFAPGDLVACVDLGYIPHSDLANIPEYCAVKVSDESFLKAASLTGLAAYALQGIRRASLQIGERVCVFGLDIIGLLTIQLAKSAGCSVIGVDVEPTRLEVAKKLGADVVFDMSREDIYKEIDLITERRGIEVSFVASTDGMMLDHAIEVSCQKGKIVLFGGANISLPQGRIYAKDVDVLVSSGLHIGQHTSDRASRWADNRSMSICLQLIEQGKLTLSPLLEEEISVKQIKQTYQRIQKKLIVGAVLAYNQSAFSQKSEIVSCHTDVVPKAAVKAGRFVPAVPDVIRVGVIGAGTFAQQTLLPLLSGLRNVSIKAVVDPDMRKSHSFAKRYKNVKTFASDEELFANDLIDVAVIASVHTAHADHALHALQNGKAILLERPMVTDFNQLQRLCSFLRKNEHAPLCVDYHYSFSPFMQKIKAVVEKRKTPLMVHYRVNRELVRSARIRSTMKAGYILGDASQIIDLFCYITDARPVSISVEAMHSSRDDIFPTDNVSVQISFNEGSVCTMLYTVLGHAGMGAERMEIFYDEKAIVMEEYMELYGFGLPSWFNETITMPDDGRERLVKKFFNSLCEGSSTPPINVDRLHMIAEVSLLIDQLACEGGGKKEVGVR